MYRDGKLTTITVIKTLVKTIFRLLVLNGVVQLLKVIFGVRFERRNVDKKANLHEN